jgi:predicted MFS family arabinose efflux permease
MGRGNDYRAVWAYALVAATSQLLWLTYAPITTESAVHFGVSEDSIGLLAEIFPLLYVLLAIPAGLLLDRWLERTLIAAAGLMAIGAAVRLSSDAYEAALAGQVLIAIAQPAVLAAITKLAAQRVAPESRAAAIGIGSAGVFVGLVTALVLGATVGADDELRPLLIVNFAVALVAVAAITLALRRPAKFETGHRVAIGLRELRGIYTDPVLSRLGAMMFLGVGVFNALATWLEVLLEPSGVSSSTTSWILVGMTVAGVVGAILLPQRIAGRGAERGFMQLVALVGVIVFALLTVIDAPTAVFLLLAALGFVLLTGQPVILELSERRAGHAAASAAGAVQLAANLGGIVIAVLIQMVNDDPKLSFALLAVFMLLIAPVARSLKPGFNERKNAIDGLQI